MDPIVAWRQIIRNLDHTAVDVPDVKIDGRWYTINTTLICFVDKETGALREADGSLITELRFPIRESLTIGATSDAGGN